MEQQRPGSRTTRPSARQKSGGFGRLLQIGLTAIALSGLSKRRIRRVNDNQIFLRLDLTPAQNGVEIGAKDRQWSPSMRTTRIQGPSRAMDV